MIRLEDVEVRRGERSSPWTPFCCWRLSDTGWLYNTSRPSARRHEKGEGLRRDIIPSSPFDYSSDAALHDFYSSSEVYL